MAAKRPRLTGNFSANLDDIEAFLGDEGASSFARLLEKLVNDAVPQLCRFPLSGRSFLERSILSTQAQALAERLKDRLREGDDIRELIVDDYLVLYLVRGKDIVFLSVKHHRQLSYDLKAFWR
ncbi:MAG TPA: type II toxin-antitoxin system RelE/ParE family toxin [Vicinamibacteria bacterium]|nr:type II toxin-antitoxin system RelE/ParE family toxin [Vicinamibacteria bacterium]